MTYETDRAIMEGAMNASCNEYFAARPQIDCIDRRRVFEAGFVRGYGSSEIAAQLLQKLKPASGWTSVKDLLPEYGQEVLTFNGRHFRVAKLGKQTPPISFRCPRTNQSLSPRVTHWMPLPEEPKGE